jgi:hypothetical protein
VAVIERGSTENHERFIEQLPELAVGVLDGRERAELLDHVDGCVSCSDELEQLMATADDLVHLAAEVDPPVGFETRVIEQIRVGTPTRLHDRWRRRWVIVTSAAAAVLIAFGLGWVAHAVGPQPVRGAVVAPGTSRDVKEASLMSGGRSLGMVAVYADEDGWLLMTVNSAGYSGTVRCLVTSGDGATRTVGTFDLIEGRGAWAAPLSLTNDGVRSAQLVDRHGRVLATARFT